jgi:hypothetical protein
LPKKDQPLERIGLLLEKAQKLICKRGHGNGGLSPTVGQVMIHFALGGKGIDGDRNGPDLLAGLTSYDPLGDIRCNEGHPIAFGNAQIKKAVGCSASQGVGFPVRDGLVADDQVGIGCIFFGPGIEQILEGDLWIGNLFGDPLIVPLMPYLSIAFLLSLMQDR